MSTTLEQIVREIHSQAVQMVLATTGGGSRAMADLLRFPGGSRTMLEAIVPYSPVALHRFLRAAPENYCSAATARAMAMAAFWRARELTADVRLTPVVDAFNTELIGIGCTASLASDRPKQGLHRIHVAVQSASATETASLELSKGARDRPTEEELAGQIVLNEIASAIKLTTRLVLPLLPGERIERVRTAASPAWKALLLGECRRIPAHATNDELLKLESLDVRSRTLYPGAFHPLHAGHRRIAEIAAELTSRPTEFEISIENVDKPPLDYTEIAQRVAQFDPSQPVWLTRAATFVEKSRLFPDSTFVVGVDTILRIAEPRYYGGETERMLAAIRELATQRSRFLVYARLIGERFLALDDLALPPELRSMCEAVPVETFRMDVSSTELRRQLNGE